ncbi:hypothetical protein LINGRAHAP2_LOCUS37421 [Linum grandiflorum]
MARNWKKFETINTVQPSCCNEELQHLIGTEERRVLHKCITGWCSKPVWMDELDFCDTKTCMNCFYQSDLLRWRFIIARDIN